MWPEVWVEHVEEFSAQGETAFIDKPKLDNARKLRGTRHIKPEDMEIEETREKKIKRSWT